MKKLLLLATTVLYFSCDSGPCKDYEVLKETQNRKHIYVKGLTKQDALCISQFLYDSTLREETFDFYEFQDDYKNKNFKYTIYYTREIDSANSGMAKKDQNNHQYVFFDRDANFMDSTQ